MQEKKTKYKAAIIGCGRIAGYLEEEPLRAKPCTHIGAYRASSEIEVEVCVSSSLENAATFAEKFGVSRIYESADEMLEVEKPDIVSVTTHADKHFEYVVKAAKAGVKAIWCEKAMATSLAEADEMIDICRAQKTLLLVNYTRRWEREYQLAADIIRRGGIGKVEVINGYFSGSIIHTGTHMFDVFCMFGGRPVSVKAELDETSKGSRESVGFDVDSDVDERFCDKGGCVEVSFDSGCKAYAHACDKKYFIFEVDVIGKEGRLRIGNGLFEYWRREPSLVNSGFYELKKVEQSFLSKDNAFVGAVNDICMRLNGDESVAGNAESARDSFEIAAAAFYSHYEKDQAECLLPLKKRDTKIMSR